MARPPNADPVATKRRILEAACELLASGQPDALTTRAVARAAGVSTGSVHNHFTDRQKLIDMCIDTMYEGVHALGADWVRELKDGAVASQVLERAVREGYRYARDHIPHVRMLSLMSVTTGELDGKRLDTTQRPMLDAGAALFASTFGLPPSDIRLRLRSIVFLVARYAILGDRELETLVDGPSEDRMAAVEEHLVRVAAALFPAPGPR